MNRLGAKFKGAKAYLRSRSKSRKPPPTLDESLGSSASVQAKDSVRVPTTKIPAGPEKVTTTPIAVGESSARSNKIWDEALSKLSDKEQNVLLGAFRPDSKLDLLQYMLDETEKREVECRSRKWKIKIGTDREVVVADKAAKIVQWLNKFKAVGDVAVSYDPVHAALPWAGVKLLLEAAVADTEAKAALVVALERIVYIIGRCKIYEKLYLDDKPAPSPNSAERQLEETLTRLYTDILSFLCTALSFYGKNAIHRTYDAILNPGKLQEFMSVLKYSEERAHRDADNCSSAQNATANKDLFENGQYLRELLDSWKDPIMQTAFSLANIQDRLTQEEREKILDWISSINHSQQHDDARRVRLEGTGNWILDHKQFLEWKRSNQSNILWLHGVPGAGKTTLTSRVVADFITKHQPQSNPDHALAFFYCAYKTPEHDKLPNLGDHEIVMNSILRQLATTGEGSILSPVLELHKKQRGRVFAPVSPLFVDTVAVLQEVLSNYQHVTVIVDGLDECEPKGRKNLLTKFHSLIDGANDSNSTVFKLFISSQRNDDIASALQNASKLALEATDNREDIAKFISDGIDSLPIGSVLKEDIGRTLQNKSEGVFQWVKLQLFRVQELSPIDKDIRKYLGKLPKDLKEAYDEIFVRIVEQSDTRKEIAERTFQWIACSTSPLSPDKLIAAVCQDPSTDEVDPIDDGITIEFILGACHNLLVFDENSNTCRFSHLSVREYIEEFCWNKYQSNGLVGRVSLWILNSPCYWNGEDETFPPGVDAIVPYVAKNWPLHVQRHGEEDIDPRLTTLLKRFLDSMNDASPAYTYWNTYLDTFGKTSWYAWFMRRRLKPSSRASLAIAFFGFHKILADWWDTGFGDIEERNEAGISLLTLAALGGRLSGVAALIDKGAIVHARGDDLTPLGGAVLGQNSEIVELMLERGADINAAAHRSDSALSLASERKNKEIVKLLLDRGADVNSSSRFSSPLGAATTGGDGEIVDLLLDRGADVNAGGGSDGSPLGSASAKGNINVVKLLLDKGADVNAGGGTDGSPLGAACCWGNKGTVKLLLDRGADVNKAGGMHGSPLGTASARGCNGIAKLLIDRGADVNKIGGIHGSPLGGAIAGKNKSILELLLHSGADVNAVGGSHGSPLGVAARVGDRDVAELLLNKGADVNAPGKDYSGPLEVAAVRGYRDTVKLLLERGANANAKGGKYGSPLAAAASESRGNKEVVELLLDSGADVDGLGGTSSPLYLARRKGKKDIMDLLIERGGNAPSESSSSEWSVDI